MLKGAEQLKIKKYNKDNELKEITGKNWKDFGKDTLMLNSADKQRIILQALSNLKATEEQQIPGYKDKTIYDDQAISKWKF